MNGCENIYDEEKQPHRCSTIQMRVSTKFLLVLISLHTLLPTYASTRVSYILFRLNVFLLYTMMRHSYFWLT